MFLKALFIFRRDLRLEDNTALLYALEKAKKVITCFIFTPEQIEHNPYRSDRCLQFMVESLQELDEELKKKKSRLHLFYGEPDKIVFECIQKLNVDAVIVNRDYTPYSIARDRKIEDVCKKSGASFLSFNDILLHAPEETLKPDGKPYKIFTPFYRNALRLDVPLPKANSHSNYDPSPISFAYGMELCDKVLPERQVQAHGGRKEALSILKKIKSFSQYESLRDFPAVEGTTHLSAHLKFTTCSVREAYHSICKEFGPHAELTRTLYWRDFFTTIAFFFPEIFKGAFQQKFNKLSWSNDEKVFQAWCRGETGFPLIDAGMRELNETGFMHNRVRMVAASFLVKDLHIDWRWGEKYFAQRLIDYDPAVNNGNWQWAASTGCDAQPYFRIFNPWNQQKKFDPQCLYIKKWVPELSAFEPKVIHGLHQEKFQKVCLNYVRPIVNHPFEAKQTLTSYKKIQL